MKYNVSEDIDSSVESAIQFVSATNFLVNFYWKEKDQELIVEFMQTFMMLIDGSCPEIREAFLPCLGFIADKTAPRSAPRTLNLPYEGNSSIAEWVGGVINAINKSPELKAAKNGILTKEQVNGLKYLV